MSDDGQLHEPESSVKMKQSDSPGDNKSHPMDQLCCTWQHRSQLRLGALAGISSDSDEFSYSAKVCVLAERRMTADTSLLYKKKMLSFNLDQGRQQSCLAEKQALSALSWE